MARLQKFVVAAKGVLHDAVRQLRVAVPPPLPVARLRLKRRIGVGLWVAPPRLLVVTQMPLSVPRVVRPVGVDPHLPDVLKKVAEKPHRPKRSRHPFLKLPPL